MNNTAIRQYVQELIEKHNTCSPFQLAELCGIQLVYAPIKSLRGYYIKSSRVKIIVISTEADDAHLGYICAHELGHALLHDKINMHYLTTKSYFPAGRYEREADVFATELLLAGSMEAGCHYEDFSIYDFMHSNGIPEKVAEAWSTYHTNL